MEGGREGCAEFDLNLGRFYVGAERAGGRIDGPVPRLRHRTAAAASALAAYCRPPTSPP